MASWHDRGAGWFTDTSAEIALLEHRRLVTLCLLAAFAVLGLAVVARLSLYADGAFYLLWVLGHRAPIDFDYARYFAQLIGQYPLALLADWTPLSLPAITAAFGTLQYLPYGLSLLACRYVLRAQPQLMIFPLLSFACAGLNATLFIVSESHVLAAMFWPLACLLTIDQKPGWKGWTLMAAFALPTLRSYESMLFLGSWLAILAGGRAYANQTMPARIAYAGLALWFLTGVAIALHWTLHPRSPGNLNSFSQSLVLAFVDGGHVNVMPAATCLGAAIVLGGMTLSTLSGRSFRIFSIVAAALVAAAVCRMILKPDDFLPISHYRARVLNVIVPLALAIAMAGCHRFGRRLPASTWTAGLATTLVILLAQLAATITIARGWTSYLATFERELARSDGICAYEDSPLASNPFQKWNWEWTMPTMSAVLSGQRIHSVIANPKTFDGWVPFKPVDPKSLPDLRAYGRNWALGDGKCRRVPLGAA